MFSLTSLKEQLDDTEVFEEQFSTMEELHDRELQLNHEIASLEEQLNELDLSIDRLPPLEIAALLELLRKKIDSCPAPMTGAVKNRLHNAKNRWHHLNFVFFFSIAQELNPDCFRSNWIHRISLSIKNKKQSRKTEHLRKKVRILQQQCQAAEELFTGRGLKTYRKLPANRRLDIEQRLWERCPHLSIENIKTEEDQEILTGAIMASLADQIMTG
jgi:hypothetical protein